MQDLVKIEESNILSVFTTDKGLDPFLEKVREEIDSFTPDISTPKGRKEVASMAMKVAKSKTYLDGKGKELVAKLKEQPRLVDAERKRMRDMLDKWKEEVRRPLTEWEEKEKARVEAHEYRLTHMRSLAHEYTDTLNTQKKNSAQLKECLSEVKAIELGEAWEEFEAKASTEKDHCVNKLEALVSEVEAAEKQAAELERLQREEEERKQKEREEQIAREAAESARLEAERKAEEERQALENKAKEEREAAERRELQLKLDAEAAERRALEAADKAKREAEAEKQREAEEAKKREANKKHKAGINNAALDALVAGGIGKNDAKKVIELIAKGLIPNVSIYY